MLFAHHRLLFSIAVFLLMFAVPKTASAQLGDLFDQAGDALGGVVDTVNDAANSAADIATSIVNRAPGEIGTAINAITDVQKFKDTVTELSKQNPEKLGQALNGLSVEKIKQGLDSVGEKLSDVVVHIADDTKLGQALNQLTAEQIGQSLNSIGNRISSVANHVGDNAKLGKALNSLSVDQIQKGLNAIGNRIGEVSKSISSNSKLGQALSQLSANKIRQGLNAIGDRISSVANHVGDNAKLGEALNGLSVNQIRKGLDAVGNRIGEVSKSIANNTKLGKALEQLTPAQIGQSLNAIGDRIKQVANHIADNAKLGEALNQLSVSKIAITLDAIPITRLQEVLEEISIEKVSGAVNSLIDLPQKAYDVLSSLAKEKLGPVMAKLSEKTIDKLLKEIKDIDKIGELFSALDAEGLASLPWEKLDQIKLPWKHLDPRNVPWEKVDPSRVQWSQIPSDVTGEASVWFNDRVDEAKKSATDFRETATTKIEDAIRSTPEIFEKLGDEVGNVGDHIGKKFEEGREFVEAQAHKLEESVRTEIGRGVRILKETPWYQELQNFLVQFSKVTAYELSTDLKMTFNSSVGSYHVEMDFVPGVTVTAQDLKTLMSGAMPMPNVDVIEVAATSANAVKIVQVSNDYEKVRRATFQQHGEGGVYFASKRFVDWASGETMVNEGFKVVATFGYGTEDALLEAEGQLMNELDEIYAWLKLRLEAEQQAQIRSILKTILKCVISGKKPQDLGLQLPELQFKTISVPYRYELQTAGITKLYEDIIREVANRLGIDWSKYRNALQKKLDDLDLNSPHGAFAIVWETKADDSQFVRDAISRFNGIDFDDQALGEQFDLLQEVLSELVENDNLPAGLKENIEKLIGHMNYASFVKNNAQSSLKQKLSDVLGFDVNQIKITFKDETPILDLKQTPLKGKLESFFDRLALGNEGYASVDVLEFNLSTYAFRCDSKIHHKHVWNLEQGLGQLSTAWKKAIGSIESFASGASSELGPTIRNALDEIDAIDEQIRNAPRQISTSARDVLDAADIEAANAVNTGVEAIQDARDRILRSADLLTDPREYILWQFMEKPSFVEIDTGLSGDRYQGEPVYYVNGVFNSFSDAKESCQQIADQVQRPIRLIYNPSFINGEDNPLNVLPGSTGTPGVGDDIAECVYDRVWISLVTGYMDISTGDWTAKLMGTKPTDLSVRLQKNPTTRQLAHLIYYSEKPVSIISHSQGCIQVRNACYSVALLGKEEQVRKKVAWVACGNPLGDSEVWPEPNRYRSIVNGNDFVAKLIGFKGGDDGEIFPLTDHLMKNYLRYLRQLDFYGSSTTVTKIPRHNQSTYVTTTSSPSIQNNAQIVVEQTPLLGLFGARIRNSIHSGDFDHDGYDDGLFVREETNSRGHVIRQLSIRYNTANKLARKPQLLQRGIFPDDTGDVVTGDFDGDGYSDVALIRKAKKIDDDTAEPGLFLCKRNNGSNGFDRLFFINESVNSDSILWDGDSIHAGDFNGDGLTDLLDFNRRTGKCRIQANLGNGKFDSITVLETVVPNSDSLCTIPIIGDFNGDGRDDLLFSTEYFELRCVLNCWAWQKVWFRVPSKHLYFSKSIGNGFRKDTASQIGPFPTRVSLVGDWNGDKFSDLVCVTNTFHNPTNDEYRMYWSLNKSELGDRSSMLDFGPIQGGWLKVVIPFLP